MHAGGRKKELVFSRKQAKAKKKKGGGWVRRAIASAKCLND
jgi:hypothetical protein